MRLCWDGAAGAAARFRWTTVHLSFRWETMLIWERDRRVSATLVEIVEFSVTVMEFWEFYGGKSNSTIR